MGHLKDEEGDSTSLEADAGDELFEVATREPDSDDSCRVGGEDEDKGERIPAV